MDANVQKTAPINRNCLDRQHERKLEDWCGRQWQHVAIERRLTLDEIAKVASANLGFLVTAPNVRGAARTMGLETPRKHNRPPRRAAALESAARVLATAMIELVREFGVKLPPEREQQLLDISRNGSLRA